LVSDDVLAQAEQAFTNIKALAEGMHVIKNVLYLTDMNDFAAVNEVYKKFFTEDGDSGNGYPARTCVAVKALPKGAKVEIESVLFKKL